MADNGKPHLSEPLPDICPYLGLSDDPNTFSAYPSQWNTCYHSKPVDSPSLTHQSGFCLSENHVNCLLFQTTKEIKMPKRMQFHPRGLTPKAKRRIRNYAIIAVILLFLIIIFFGRQWIINWLGVKSINSAPTKELAVVVTENEIPVVNTGVLPSPTTANQIQLTVTPTTIAMTPTSTQTPLNPPLALETPIGSEIEIVIHRVLEGESLLLFANWYQTSTDAIQAVNIDLTYPIQAGSLIIIPVGIIDASSLPQFEAYEVLTDGTSVQELAQKTGASVVDICTYNNIGENQILDSGDWLVIPRLQNNP